MVGRSDPRLATQERLLVVQQDEALCQHGCPSEMGSHPIADTRASEAPVTDRATKVHQEQAEANRERAVETMDGTLVDTHPQGRDLLCVHVPSFLVPEFRVSAGTFPQPHGSYYSLGHCLRTNIFPGLPQTCCSLASDSYSTEIPPRDPLHWHGRKTDALGKWIERNFMNQKLNKALGETGSRNGKN